VRRLDGTLESALEKFGRPDIVHDNGVWLLHNHRLAVLAARRGIPRTVSTRGMLEPWAMQHKHLKKRLAWLAYQRKDLRRASAMHATNEVEARNVGRLGLDVPVRVIPNGVDLPHLDENVVEKGSVRTALFMGRIYPVKGLPMLIDAWARVRPEGWRLVIAGPDEAGHEALIRKLVSDSGLGHVVEFAGQLDGNAKREAFSSAELFILPTHSESFGVAIAEALSYGMPVLTTTAAPWPELESRGCGWSVAPTGEGIARGLAAATARPPHDLGQMGRRGREYVAANYAWSVIGPEFRDWLESVIRA
jgi:glycosyltransferase involved in cell wall biosynthesis